MSEERVCKNCDNAYRRCNFSFKKYGNYQCTYECLATDRITYKKADETCTKFKEKKK